MRVASAWQDSDYGDGLSNEAKAFPHYPLDESVEYTLHLPWWVIREEYEPVAICNIETNQLIMKSGVKYDLTKVENEGLINIFTKG